MASRQPLQAGHIQYGHLVPCQAESLQASELLQHGGHAGEGVEGQAKVGEGLQRRELPWQSAQAVSVQEESLQAGDTEQTTVRTRENQDPDQSGINPCMLVCS